MLGGGEAGCQEACLVRQDRRRIARAVLSAPLIGLQCGRFLDMHDNVASVERDRRLADVAASAAATLILRLVVSVAAPSCSRVERERSRTSRTCRTRD